MTGFFFASTWAHYSTTLIYFVFSYVLDWICMFCVFLCRLRNSIDPIMLLIFHIFGLFFFGTIWVYYVLLLTQFKSTHIETYQSYCHCLGYLGPQG